MSPVFDVSTDEGREEGLEAAVSAVRTGQCVVLPTDTVYGIGTDAFSAAGVEQLLNAKGRGRDMPPPVLIGDRAAVDGLATGVPSYAKRLMDAFWPGGLTLIFRSQPTLAWDLGDTNGTVGLRMPDHPLLAELLHETGPMAVSSANRTGQPTVATITEAGFAFGPSVEVYLDAGELRGSEPSTILDCTKADPVVLRHGAISAERLRGVLGDVELIDPVAESVAAEERAKELAAQQPELTSSSEGVSLGKHAASEPVEPAPPTQEAGHSVGSEWDTAATPAPSDTNEPEAPQASLGEAFAQAQGGAAEPAVQPQHDDTTSDHDQQR